MIPDNLLFIQVVPIDQYFLWQVEVQIVNFRKFNLTDRMQVLVWYPDRRTPELAKWRELSNKYPEVEFFYYIDEGVDLALYIPQLRPHSLKKHFKYHKERLKNKVFFYHDSDIIFNYLPDFNKLVKDDICWQSDTSSYLDYNYLRRKEIEGNIPEDYAVGILADIGRVTVKDFVSYANKTGGAQYILKFIDSAFWADVERQVLEIRKKFYYFQPGSINSQFFKTEEAGFQSWCADMWAVNMALWSRGIVTNITPDLDFCWATNNIDEFNRKPIFHNAGVTPQHTDLFYKSAWIKKSPIGVDLPLPPETSASRKYVEAILEVK